MPMSRYLKYVKPRYSTRTVLHLSTSTRVLVIVLESFKTRKIFVLVSLCTRYSFEKAIECTSTLSDGKQIVGQH